MKSKKRKLAGYCMLCRTLEIKKYETLVGVGIKHTKACKEAKCLHPPHYVFDKK